MKHILRYVMAMAMAIPLVVLGSLMPGDSAYAQDAGLPAGITGTTWQLVEIQRSAQDILDTSAANINLLLDDNGRATGNSSCNGYSAPYQTGAGDAFDFGDILSTLRACVDTSLMSLETEYFGALDGVTSYKYDGATLQLFYNKGGSLLKFSSVSSPVTIPGMPPTGSDNSTYTAILAGGVLLVLLGAAFLMFRLITRRTSGT